MNLPSLHNCPAPAKLNLFLQVTGRRADGYHLLQTVFQLIAFGDTLHFDLRDDGRIQRLTDLPGIPAGQDLCVRAARLLQTHSASAQKMGVDIRIDKRLPQGGGLGGGSSDAATVLLALNHLWQTGLNRRQLMALALQLGADVPFFLCGGNAFAEGVGDQLQLINTPDCWFVVIEPGVSIPTAQIFSAPELTRNSKPVRISDFSDELGAELSSGTAIGWKNDLQVVACKQFPVVAEVIQWLAQYGPARMTGSGACVFCAFQREADAHQVLQQVPPRWRAWKTKALSQHPLAYLLEH